MTEKTSPTLREVCVMSRAWNCMVGLVWKCEVELPALETVILGTQSFTNTETMMLNGVDL